MKIIKRAKNNKNPGLCLDLNQDVFRWKVNGYPALICLPFLGMHETPYGWPKSEILFKAGDCFWYSNWKDIDKNGDAYFQHYLKGRSDFPAFYYKHFWHSIRDLSSRSANIIKADFSSLSQKDFKSCWQDFSDFYNSFWKLVIIPEVAGYALSRRLSAENYRRKKPLSPEHLSFLTSFSEPSFLAQEETSLCRLALIKDKKEREEGLRKHRSEFHWILNGYHGVRYLSVDFFRRQLEDLRRSGQSAIRLKELMARPDKHKKEVVRMIREYGLSPLMRQLALLTQRGSYLQDCRKAAILQAMPAIIKLYQELARRVGIDNKSIMYVLPAEINKCLDGRLSVKEIKARIRGVRFSLVIKPYLYDDINFKYFFSILENAYSGASKGVSGTIAHPGRVKARARVLNRVQDCADFKKGEVLVALMTSPDYILAMKQAAAIVTDDGGLTCHAAITARELNKPCIVGTRNASKLIKTGDLVEVDADKGIVRIIKRK